MSSFPNSWLIPCWQASTEYVQARYGFRDLRVVLVLNNVCRNLYRMSSYMASSLNNKTSLFISFLKLRVVAKISSLLLIPKLIALVDVPSI